MSVRGFVRGHHRMVAATCHLWCWLGPLCLLPLALRAMRMDTESELLRTSVRDVLNLQVVALVPMVVAVAAALAGLNLLVLAVFVGGWVPVIGYGYVCGIVGALRSLRGVSWRYPVALGLL